MKRILAIVISLGLLYGGVAWAIEDCLKRAHHPADHNHHSSDVDNAPVTSNKHHQESEAPAPRIHCADLMALLGPAARASINPRSGLFCKADDFVQPSLLFTSDPGRELDEAFSNRVSYKANLFLRTGVPSYLIISVLII